MVFGIEDVRMIGDTGIARVRVRYDAQARGSDGGYGGLRVAQLPLIFAREDGDWRLVYDQNTVAAPAST